MSTATTKKAAKISAEDRAALARETNLKKARDGMRFAPDRLPKVTTRQLARTVGLPPFLIRAF